MSIESLMNNWKHGKIRYYEHMEELMSDVQKVSPTVAQVVTARDEKDRKTAFQMCQLAFELRYLRDELIRMGAYNALPPCKTALGDAAQQLETLAEVYRKGGVS